MKNYIQKVAWALVLLLAATLSLSAKDGTAVRKLFKKGVSDSISVGGSKLVVLQKDLIRNRSLSVNSIGEENVPELDFDVVKPGGARPARTAASSCCSSRESAARCSSARTASAAIAKASRR